MGDMGEIFNFMKEQKKEKRRARYVESLNLIDESGIPYVSKNEGQHLIFSHKKGSIDFWPSSGLYIPRWSNSRYYGVKRLINLLRKE